MQVLITTSSFNLKNFVHLSDLESAGIQVRLNPYAARLSEEQAIELIGTTTIGMIAGLEPLTAKVLQSATSLKVIARCGMGLDSVDLDMAKARGITVLNTPDAPTRAVAELTLGHILGLLRNISQADRQIRNGTWKGLMGSLLEDRIVGVIGFGRIGCRVASLLAAFGARVIVCDSQLPGNVAGIEVCDIDTLCSRSDIVTLHLPYDETTHHLINERRLMMMKQGSYLVNVARGGLVDDAALYDALSSGHLAGAALDCFEQEPYSGPLTTLDNVQLTAHMGSYARETRDLMEQEASRLLVAALRDKGIIS